MGNGNNGQQKMRGEIQAQNERVSIPAQVSCLSNPRIIRERKQRGDINASLVVFIVKGKKVAQIFVNKGGITAALQYNVKPYTNAGPNSLYPCYCVRGHLDCKCS
jgi:hypothetical protein